MSRAIQQNVARYPDPEAFLPERPLDTHPLSAAAYANSPDVAQRDHFSYGGGKRTCVGMHLAERSLFTMTARLLQTFDFLPGIDQDGRKLPVDANDVTTGLIMAARPFKCRFTVRSEEVRKLLEREGAAKVQDAGESWS